MEGYVVGGSLFVGISVGYIFIIGSILILVNILIFMELII